MAATDRPSGLTALAVINFLLSLMQGFAILDLLLTRFVFASNLLDRADRGNHEAPAAQVEMLRDLFQVSPLHVGILATLMALSGLLLLATGFGYLKRRRFWGRHLTTAYVICDLTYVGALLALMPESYVRSLGIGLLRTAFYPIFLGGVIHTVFRRDLVR